MKNSPVWAAVALGVSMAACSGNGASPLPSMPGVNGGTPGQSQIENVPQGWAATFTHALPDKNFAQVSKPNAVPVTMPLHVVVGLAMRDRAGAQQYLRTQYASGGANFHRWLTPQQFTAMFNPTRAQAAAVAQYLERQGFTHATIEPNNLIVSATGTVAHAEEAFHTSIQGVMSNGRLVYGNVKPAFVPAKLKGVVMAVLGLSNAYEMHVHLKKTQYPRMVPASGTPAPCLQVVNGICIGGEYGPPQYQVAYDAACSACSTGKKTAVAVIAEGNVKQVVKDLRTAEAFWGLPKVKYTKVQVGTPSADTSGIDEWDLDTQIASGMADKLDGLYVYDTTSLGDSDIALAYSKWVNDNLTRAGNSSFGEVESVAFVDGAMALDDQEFNQAASQGMTMFASTGDNGTGCPVLAATGAPNSGAPEVCYPASSPYVVAVGGTTLDTNANGSEPGTYYGEHVWVGTGGGFSAFESAPYWQSNGICATCGPAAIRGLADISMCGDNNGCPMDVFVNGAQEGVGGTSLSSPMSMGIWARLETHYHNRLGFAAPIYYGVYGYYEPCPLQSTACTPSGEPGNDTPALPPDTTAPIGGFHDILYGSNGIPSAATPGWDEPSGLGSVDYYVMQQDLANSIF